MKKLLLFGLLMIECSFFNFTATAQNELHQAFHQRTDVEQNVSSDLNELLGINLMITPQPNRAAVAKQERESMEKPFRYTEVITKNEKGENYMRYTYTYDEKGTGYGPGEAMVRKYQQWNKIDEVWDNSMRFKVILDDKDDMIEYYTDLGYKTQWDNYYRSVCTYDENHNQLTVDQEYWENDQWYSKLRWTNTYDTNGNVISRIYENRPTDGPWSYGLKQTWTYDEAGRELTALQESFINGGYNPITKDIYAYDDKGNLTSWIKEQNGIPIQAYTYEYDENSNQTGLLLKRWSEGEWVNSEYTTFTFDSQNRQVGGLSQAWSGNDWINKTKFTVQYASFGSNQKVLYKYDAEKQDWLFGERLVNMYNEKLQQVTWARDLWNSTANNWSTLARDRYTYDANFNLTEKISESRYNEEWMPTSVHRYEYNEDQNGISVKSSKKQQKETISLYYNGMQSKWGCPDMDSWIADAIYLDLQEYVKTTDVTLNHEKYELETGLNFTLIEDVQPANASNKEVYWSSSDENIARVSVDGKVYGISEGIATVTVRTLNGDHIASCEVTVSNDPTSVHETLAKKGFVYQNETIRFNEEQVSCVRISDINGRIILNQTNGRDIITTRWERGLYFLQFSDNTGIVTHKLFIY